MLKTTIYWIKVEEEKPELDREILVGLYGEGVEAGKYIQPGPDEEPAFFEAKSGRRLDNVTHWKYVEDAGVPSFLRIKSGCKDGER